MVSCKAKKQTTVSRSSAEAEYCTIASTAIEVTWIQQLLRDFHVSFSSPALIFCDNQAAFHIASNPTFHERTKHIEIDCHIVRNKILDDIFTKPLPSSTLIPLLSKMAVCNIHRPS